MPARLPADTAIYLHSEALVMINYSAGRRIIEAEFSNHKVYQYQKVPLKKWQAFLSVINSGGSAGEFINRQVKPFYKFVQIQ
ncbi:KTSC domain-containing protein [Foetidibacter luteolus]|uniref:KTSC domain-containing protein n=1 Tax=Foetidibacter luteolus TaxID=2608880 RepID=UPI00129AEDF9|nr:KTSC domain-containing protein [Foetidibacter luteolus]